MLTTIAAVKGILAIPSTDTTKDAQLTAFLTAAQSAVESWCKRKFEARIVTEYRSGSRVQDLTVRNRPIRYFRPTCSLTSGSATTTITDADDFLMVGMPAIAVGALPQGATIASISGDTVTFSAAAIKTTSADVHMGIRLHTDAGGFSGQGNDPWPSTSEMYPGQDFLVERDQDDGTCKSGILRRLGGGSLGTPWDWPGAWRRGSLTARMAPTWPGGVGNIRVIFCAGYMPSEVPADLKIAVEQICIWIWRNAPHGGIQATSESYEGYSFSLGNLGGEPGIADVRRILSAYRETVI